MSHKIVFLALSAMLLALCVPASAQQPKKVPRIGYLEPGTASGNTVLLDGFRQELSKLGWIEGKNITTTTGLPSKRMSAYLSSPRTWSVLRLT